MFNGLNMGIGNLYKLSDAVTRSISAENPTGEKSGGAREPGRQPELGIGWKARPCVAIAPGVTYTVADITGEGAVQSIWMTGFYVGSELILRIYWDDNEVPSVECPLSAFFGYAFDGWIKNGDTGRFPTLNSLPVLVAPRRGLNCFWQMPFKKHCLITLDNTGEKAREIYYQINYTLTDIGDDFGYFHAQYRQQRPVEFKKEYTIVDGIKGKGQYVGTAFFATINSSGKWWGEGEVKFFMDGDEEFPTICGTGTEDYFGGAFNWDVNGEYTTYSAPFMGMYYFIKPEGYCSQARFSCYRWHILDPIRFESDIKVTIQDLGWRNDWRYLPRRDDFMSVAYWYQSEPAKEFPKLPSRDELEIVME